MPSPLSRPRFVLSLAVLLTIALASLAAADEELGRYLYPLAKEPAATDATIEVDLTDVPGDESIRRWADDSKALCENWLPIVRRFLATDDWSPPQTIRLVFKKELDAPAKTAKDVIYVSVPHVNRHRDDFGMIIHELTHVVQNYPPGQPGWLVEGIADYIRYWKYEPEKPHRPIGASASYKDSYNTSAAFLAWLVWKHDRRIVSRLDDALRHGRYHEELFQEWTGKPVEALWADFLAGQKTK